MASDPDVVHDALERVLDEVRRWPDVRVSESDDDGTTQVLYRRGVLARLHADGLVEVPFPRAVGEKLVAEGRAERHHALPDSGWVDVRLGATADAPRVLDLLRLAHEARLATGAPADEVVDQSVEDTFPASDPPASGRD